MYNSKLKTLITVAALLTFTAAQREPSQSDYTQQLKELQEVDNAFGKNTCTADSIEGKMIILNFWASYDPASRINNFDLLELQKKYRNQQFYNAEGLKVVSISLDIFQTPLKKAIETDGTNQFCHLCDFKGTDSQICKMFDVKQPVNLLVDPQGKILARDFATASIADALNMLQQN